MKAVVYSDVLAEGHGLACARGQECSGRCEDRAGTYFGSPEEPWQWSTCPVRAVHDDVRLSYVLRLDHMARLSTVAGVMDDYVAWVPEVWSLLDNMREERKAANVRGR